MNAIQWKVCGMKEPENIQSLYTYGPHYMGLIFYPRSPRYVLNDPYFSLPTFKGSMKTVGVFVNEEVDVIMNLRSRFNLDVIQLHGQESPEYCQVLSQEGMGIIKAFSIGKDTFDFSLLEQYEDYCDFFLFDTKGKLPGGNGYTFNWELLKAYDRQTPFFLSGGIGLAQLDRLAALLESDINIHAIDVNSQFEISPGIKDMEKISALAEWLEKWNAEQD